MTYALLSPIGVIVGMVVTSVNLQVSTTMYNSYTDARLPFMII